MIVCCFMAVDWCAVTPEAPLLGPSTAAAQYRRRTPRARRRIAVRLRAKSVRLMKKGKLSAAIKGLKRSQKMYPNTRTLFYLGRCHELAGKPDEARRFYDRLPIRTRRRLSAQLRRQGLAQMAQGKYKAAIINLKLSTTLLSSEKVFFLLGQCHELAGQLQKARKIYRRLLDEGKDKRQGPMIKRRLAGIDRQLGDQPEPPDPGTDPTTRPPEPSRDPDEPQISQEEDSRSALIFGDEEKGDGEDQKPKEGNKLLGLATDKLELGGFLFLRFAGSFSDGSTVDDQKFSMPNLLDLYLDGRPNDRLRGYVSGRLSYNPTREFSSQVKATLNEFWLKFDLARVVFVTIGQQMVHWGTSKLWNPTDMINTEKRPLLSPFDARSGVPLVKLHLPIESLSWNFYLVGMLDRLDSYDKAGVAGRAEFVFSTVEIGLTSAYRHSVDPKIGLDLSAGLWDFDITGEMGLSISDQFSSHLAVQIAAGLEYSMSIFDDDQFIVGAEYFFNQQGSSDPDPGQIYSGQAQSFYLGRHYAALFANLPAPGKLNDWSFVLRTIGNMNDLSFTAQFMVSVKVLTFMSITAFVRGHLGQQGELRIGDDAFRESTRYIYRRQRNPDHPERKIPTEVIDVNLWLRVDI